MKYLTGILVSLLCLAAACQKKDDPAPDTSKLNVQVNAPLNNTVFHKGDTVFIQSDVNYITQMHGYNVRIDDTGSGIVYYESEDHVHGDYFSVDEYWVNTLDHAAVLRLRITVILDHDGNTGHKDILINTQP